MSLQDSLFLDPVPGEVWIAYRTDGIKGSGTPSDPLDASTRYAAPVSVTSATNTGGDLLEATANTSAAHGFSNGDVVTIDGVTGSGAARWNGTFVIYSVTANSFKYYMVGQPAAGSTTGDIITASKVLGYRFDGVLNSLPARTRVHLGPTSSTRPFLTRGYASGVTGGWQPKAGMKISGAGMDVTTLQLVGQELSNTHFFAIGHGFGSGGSTPPNSLDFFEVSDLTIDCNLMLRPSSAAVCGAIRILGNYARVRNVKAKNWGTKSSTVTCFVIAMITADPASNAFEIVEQGIESCIVVEPGTSISTGKVNLLHAGGTEAAATSTEAYGRGPYIRDCFIDCGTVSATPEYRAVSMGWCREGLVEGNQIHNTTYGGPYQDKTTTRDIIVRNNYYRNVLQGPFWNLGLVDPPTPSALSSLVRDPSDNSIAQARTVGAHTLQARERVKISGSANSPDQFKGVFVIKDIQPPDGFRYQMTAAPLQDATSPTMQKVFGVGRLVVEGNVIELPAGTTGQTAIHLYDANLQSQTPDRVYGDVIIRGNKIRYADGFLETNYTGYAVDVSGAKNLQVRENVVDLTPANPLRNTRSSSVEFFNNKTPAGVLLEGLNLDTGFKYEELETEADFGLIMSFFTRRRG